MLTFIRCKVIQISEHVKARIHTFRFSLFTGKVYEQRITEQQLGFFHDWGNGDQGKCPSQRCFLCVGEIGLVDQFLDFNCPDIEFGLCHVSSRDVVVG